MKESKTDSTQCQVPSILVQWFSQTHWHTHTHTADDSCSLLCFVRRESQLRKTNYSNSMRFKPEETTKLNCRKRCLRAVTIPALPSMQIVLCTYILKYIQSYIYALLFLSPSQTIRDAGSMTVYINMQLPLFIRVASLLTAITNSKYFPDSALCQGTICVSNWKSGFCCEWHSGLADGARAVRVGPQHPIAGTKWRQCATPVSRDRCAETNLHFWWRWAASFSCEEILNWCDTRVGTLIVATIYLQLIQNKIHVSKFYCPSM